MNIAIGSDHHGVEMRRRLVAALQDAGHNVTDAGAHGTTAVDYPDIAAGVAGHVTRGDADRGILFCGTGIGMAMAANKFPGIRAAVVHDESTTQLSRQHNNANVMCLSADAHDEETIHRLVNLWLETDFEGGRHARRVDKIGELENRG